MNFQRRGQKLKNVTSCCMMIIFVTCSTEPDKLIEQFVNK